ACRRPDTASVRATRASAPGTSPPPSPPGGGWRLVSGRPRAVVWAARGVAVACGWAAAAAMVAAELARGTVAGLGPGMGLLDLLGDRFAPGPLAQAILDTLCAPAAGGGWAAADIDRKSTRLNSSHV